MSEVVFALLLLTCSGHTNAECHPSVTVYKFEADCEKARIIPEQDGFLGIGAAPAHKNPRSVCFPIPIAETTKLN